MAQRTDLPDDTPLDDDDPAPDLDEWRGRIADLLADPAASDGTIRFLESLEEQARDRGFLTSTQKARVEEIEERRADGRRRF